MLRNNFIFISYLIGVKLVLSDKKSQATYYSVTCLGWTWSFFIILMPPSGNKNQLQFKFSWRAGEVDLTTIVYIKSSLSVSWMHSLWLYMTLSHIHFLYMQGLPTNATYHVLHLMSYLCMRVLVHIWGNLSYLFLQLGCAAQRLVRWRGIGVHGPPWTTSVRLFHRSLTVATRAAKFHDHRHAGGHSLPACGFSSCLSSVNLEMKKIKLN